MAEWDTPVDKNLKKFVDSQQLSMDEWGGLVTRFEHLTATSVSPVTGAAIYNEIRSKHRNVILTAMKRLSEEKGARLTYGNLKPLIDMADSDHRQQETAMMKRDNGGIARHHPCPKPKFFDDAIKALDLMRKGDERGRSMMINALEASKEYAETEGDEMETEMVIQSLRKPVPLRRGLFSPLLDELKVLQTILPEDATEPF